MGNAVDSSIGSAVGGGLLMGTQGGQSFLNNALNGPPMPNAPDFTGAAQATSAGNLQNAQNAFQQNMINQYTPYGSLTYKQTGTNAQGQPIYSATQSLSPEQQNIYNQQTALSGGLMGLANQGLNGMRIGGVDMSQLPSTGINPGQSYSQAMMAQLQPQLNMQRNSLNQNLANQGIPIGSEAWRNAQTQQAQNENQLLNNAITSGMGVGLQANNQAYNQMANNQMMPINQINAIRAGSGVQGPNYVNTPQMQAVAGPDYSGAAAQQNQFNMNMYNQQAARQNALMGGLFSLGAAAI
jgi:hypothetical protein